MLDYINNYFAVFTLWVSNAIEFSGLLHSSYLIQMLVAKLAGQTIESGTAHWAQSFFFYLRCLGSLAILGFSFAVTLAGHSRARPPCGKVSLSGLLSLFSSSS
jgi:hypothetical protein